MLEYAFKRALNSAVECHPHTVEVIGSNPIAPTISIHKGYPHFAGIPTEKLVKVCALRAVRSQTLQIPNANFGAGARLALALNRVNSVISTGYTEHLQKLLRGLLEDHLSGYRSTRPD